ncbi:Kunitz/Bovine pancreatic trypsin inhibitor domain protein [Ostertagia ostertagi]
MRSMTSTKNRAEAIRKWTVTCHSITETEKARRNVYQMPASAFTFDRAHGKCARFWYLGCGGNANNFFSYEVCQRSCRTQMQRLERRPRANSNGTSFSSNVGTVSTTTLLTFVRLLFGHCRDHVDEMPPR